MDIPLWQQIILQLLLQILFILLNAVFACAEIAVINSKDAKLDKLADDGNKSAIRLKKLTDNPAKFLASIQVAVTLSGFIASAFAAENFGKYIVAGLSGKIGLSDGTINTISVVVITLILSYFTLVFGELVPKRMAMNKPEKIALKLSGTVRFVSIVFAPLVWLLTVAVNGVLRLLRINPDDDGSGVSEEDIRMLADAGSEDGSIDREENEMIQNVFEFDDITVGEIATHRTEMVVLWAEDTDEEWAATIHDNPHDFYPICGSTIDNITGILAAEKYLRLTDRSLANVLHNAIVKPRFVAQVMKADVLFHELKRGKSNNIAIVVDEYGGTYGIVTMYDLIEQIVGTLDESEEENDIVKSGNGYIVSGLADREDFCDVLDIDSESDSATVGGWVMEHLEKIPEVGDTFEQDGVKITVTKANRNRVLEISAEKQSA